MALDDLEHTDKIYAAFAELARVSRRYVLVALPKAYEVASRVRFLRGQPLSGKYGLPPQSLHLTAMAALFMAGSQGLYLNEPSARI